MIGDLDDLPTPLLAAAATPYVAVSGAANVVMQLARPAIGYAVKDSVVTEGSLFGNPSRRRRTTVGFLAVAVHGSAAERAAFRAATNGSHARVPGAFDPELQRWVAACLFHGFEQAREAVHGPLGSDRERFYAEGAIFGAMLQMPASWWPADRDAFEDYWREGLAATSIDDPVRDYLLRVVRLEYIDGRVPAAVVRRRLHVTAGFLPEHLRQEMRLPWSAADERRFDRFSRRLALVVRHLPAGARGFPFTRSIDDVRRRMATGEPIF
ncbi:hypothetical protein HMPREF0063_10816 [Aeromicrobium marinum DSM 15272]|uniref:ER-bound oxygenase mpaB/mpaB'/Rubber oxygenase catalytic domain-containing protein n=1 Tax=Aeromicrobium marinum DSM 15272 TaxID=585531 RepID=E2SA26_9ACTN|nr:oxygenase MpaB family protein [Aeromicrobium marinum]EFQ84100.1 hypothetical protein HMPREF0063_10816 [Aeromicrobium marinum DSM 15272]